MGCSFSTINWAGLIVLIFFTSIFWQFILVIFKNNNSCPPPNCFFNFFFSQNTFLILLLTGFMLSRLSLLFFCLSPFSFGHYLSSLFSPLSSLLSSSLFVSLLFFKIKIKTQSSTLKKKTGFHSLLLQRVKRFKSQPFGVILL